jgi:hypothetical protein
MQREVKEMVKLSCKQKKKVLNNKKSRVDLGGVRETSGWADKKFVIHRFNF